MSKHRQHYLTTSNSAGKDKFLSWTLAICIGVAFAIMLVVQLSK